MTRTSTSRHHAPVLRTKATWNNRPKAIWANRGGSALRRAGILALAFLVALAVPAFASGPRMDLRVRKHLRERPDRLVKVIVRVEPGRRGLVKKLLAQYGATLRNEHSVIEGITLSVTPRQAERLARHPHVLSVSEDTAVYGDQLSKVMAPAVPTTPVNLQQTVGVLHYNPNASLMPYEDGLGVGVAIIDSGIAPRADLAGRIVAFRDFTSGVEQVVPPVDGYGHGTHVASIVAGSGALAGYNQSYQGVSNLVSLIGLRVLNNQGQGSASHVIAAIQWAVANRTAYNIKVINLSLGHPIFEAAATDPMVQAVEAAVRAGITVVSSAGNYGQSPTTGAVGHHGGRARHARHGGPRR